MLIHIVSPGETISKIADGYHLSYNDIKANNLHITDFYHLAAGTKLKIPFITKEKQEVLEETEPFISDYYPTYNGYLDGTKKSSEKPEEVISEKKEEVQNPVIIEEETKKVEVKPVDSKVLEAKQNNSYIMYNPMQLYFGNIIPNYDKKYIRKI